MTGSLRVQNGIYHAIIRYKDTNGKKTSLSRSTGYAEKGNKKKAEARLAELIEELKYLEFGYIPDEADSDDEVLLTDAVKQWLEGKENKIGRTAIYGGISVRICPDSIQSDPAKFNRKYRGCGVWDNLKHSIYSIIYFYRVGAGHSAVGKLLLRQERRKKSE